MQAATKQYLTTTRTATYGFLSVLPLLVLYETLILWVNEGQAMQVRVGADVWIKQLLALFGGTGMFVITLVVLLIGVGVYLYERKKQIPLRPRYFAWMLGESVVYAVVAGLIVSYAVGFIFLVAPATVAVPLIQEASPLAQQGLGTQLALSLGAGLYEELVFRVILVGGLFWVLNRALSNQKKTAYIVAALIGALVFSAVHYIGSLGDTFTLASFTFRFFFGLLLNALFLIRGFGVAAWTHALYDVMVVTGMLG